MPVQSSPVRTFVFADIEGSTRLWENHEAAMRAATARLSVLASEMATDFEPDARLKRYEGGDSLLFVFHSAKTALEFALAFQKALQKEPWPGGLTLRMRMALHTGEGADYRDADYFGRPLNRCARLLAIGHGGQILLSDSCRAHVADYLPAQASLRDEGEHRLKDLDRPERVTVFCHPDLPDITLPLRSLEQARHNLPIVRTRLVGREKEMEDISRLLRSEPLVTLKGEGGIGKTRIAQQVAADGSEEFPDGICFVSLESLTEAEQLEPLIASTLTALNPVMFAVGADITQSLQNRRLLLILDNSEHLIEASARVADRLLDACARLKILATSHEALRVEGESVYQVPPLAVPEHGSSHAPETLYRSPAITLFVERARAARHDFQLTAHNAPDIVRICKWLQGIPLWIEMAAGQIRKLAPHEIAGQLEQSLQAGNRFGKDRQKSAETVIRWCFAPLSPEHQNLMHRLSVFAGGFQLEDALAVCAETETDDTEMRERLLYLAERSLILVEEQRTDRADSTYDYRYALRNVIRAYCQKRLSESTEEAFYRARHRQYFLQQAIQAEEHLRQQDENWLNRVERSHENFRAALELPGADARETLQMAYAIHIFWLFRGYWKEGLQRLESSLACCPKAAMELRANAANAAGVMAYNLQDYDTAFRLCSESLRRFQQRKDEKGSTKARNNLGLVALKRRDFAEAGELFSRCLQYYTAHNMTAQGAAVLCNIGVIAYHQQNFAEAYRLFAESSAAHEKAGTLFYLGDTLRNLGMVCLHLGNFEEGLHHHRKSLAIQVQYENPEGEITSLYCVAAALCYLQRHETSQFLFRAARHHNAVIPCLLEAEDLTLYAALQQKNLDALTTEQAAACANRAAQLSLAEAIEIAFNA